MRALSVRQPWAWAIIHAGKNIENRNWQTKYRGPLLIHAGRTLPTGWDRDIVKDTIQKSDRDFPDCEGSWNLCGGIIGSVELVDCVHVESVRAGKLGLRGNPWARGPWLWMFRDPEPIDFVPLRGQLNIFEVDIDARPQAG